MITFDLKNMEFLKEFFLFLKAGKKFWLLPLMLILLLMALIVVATGGPALSAFIYTLF